MPRYRRVVLQQIRNDQSIAVWRGDQCLALAMFRRDGWRRIEMALAIAPAAARHMRFLVRATQLTLRPMAETSLIVAAIHPDNDRGQRMARLVGFRPARLKSPFLWVFRKGCDDGQHAGR